MIFIKDIILKIVVPFILSGGLGYINYIILSLLGTINVTKKNTEEKKVYLIFFSILNILIFYVLNRHFNDYLINFIFTIIITIVFSFTLYEFMFKWLFKLLNYCRKNKELGEIQNREIENILFDKNRVLFAYVYDLRTHELLCYGCLGYYNINDGELNFEIIPFPNLDEYKFDEAMNACNRNNGSSIYVNTSKNLKIVIIPEPND